MRQLLEKIMERYQKSLYLASYNICRNADDANDVVQDTFVQYFHSAKQFYDEDHIRAWLIRVAINMEAFQISLFRSNISLYGRLTEIICYTK